MGPHKCARDFKHLDNFNVNYKKVVTQAINVRKLQLSSDTLSLAEARRQEPHQEQLRPRIVWDESKLKQ